MHPLSTFLLVFNANEWITNYNTGQWSVDCMVILFKHNFSKITEYDYKNSIPLQLIAHLPYLLLSGLQRNKRHTSFVDGSTSNVINKVQSSFCFHFYSMYTVCF